MRIVSNIYFIPTLEKHQMSDDVIYLPLCLRDILQHPDRSLDISPSRIIGK